MLGLDRPFTYLLPEGVDAGLGSLVSVKFHGRTVRGWILGPASEPPESRLLPVTRVRSQVRFFDQGMLEVLRWMSERYIAPLAAVIARSHPPRVAGEESAYARRRVARGGPAERSREAGGYPRVNSRRVSPVLARYGGLSLDAGVTTWLRPLPGDEALACVEAVEACLDSGDQALVLVPEAEPLPETARAVLDRFGSLAVAFVGGEPRDRYRTWLQILEGRYDVVVGTRPAIFAPLSRLGLAWISREVHPGHREDRSPYYHVRDVAMARARIEGGACVVASFSPSVETASLAANGSIRRAAAPRSVERSAAPLVETATPEAEDRSNRLGALLRGTGSAALILSRRGSGVARVCRQCGEPAACASCQGPLVLERGRIICGVCRSPGRCLRCGSERFAVEPGGVERLAGWAARRVSKPVELDREGDVHLPGPGTVLVGSAAAVRDIGGIRLDVVAILDPDRALARAGVHAGERAVATWMEAAAWAGPRAGGGRVLVQTRHPGHPAIQALVRWEPTRFLLGEARRREEAGFPAGHPVFRIEGTEELPGALPSAAMGTVLTTSSGPRTVCLVTVRPDTLPGFRSEVLRLAADGVVARVEAEPQL